MNNVLDIKSEFENERFDIMDAFIDNNDINDKNLFFYKISCFIESLNLMDIFPVINHLLKNEKVLSKLKLYVKNNTVSLVNIRKNYQTDELLLMLRMYCNKNKIQILYDNFELKKKKK